MINRTPLPIVTCLVLLVFDIGVNSPVRADWVVHNAPPASQEDTLYEMVQSDITTSSISKQRVANRFAWAPASEVSGLADIALTFWGGFTGTTLASPVVSAPLDFQVTIYEYDGFGPEPPGAIASQQTILAVAPTAVINAGENGFWVNQYDVYLTEAGFELTPGSDYWLEVADVDPDTGSSRNAPAWQWVSTQFPFSGNYRKFNDVSNWVYSPTSRSSAFRITAVPEPGSICLISLTLMGIFTRKKRNF